MRSVIVTVAAAVCFAFAGGALAADSYRFHLTFTDGRTAMLAGPRELLSRQSDRSLARLATKQVFLFTLPSGTRWTWLSFGCPNDRPACELTINDSGTCSGRNAACDLGFTVNGDGTVQTRCYRESCGVRVTPRAGSPAVEATLGADEARNFPLDADFEFTFSGQSIATRPQ